MTPRLLTTQEAAERLGLTPVSLQKLRWQDDGLPIFQQGLAVHYRLEDLEAFEQREVRNLLRQVLLAAYVAAHKPKQLTQPLFYTQRSVGFTANTLTHIVNGIYKGAGISGATSHSGRRTGLTNLSERGVGVRVLMALAGHRNMATTQRYIDLRPAMLKAAVELI